MLESRHILIIDDDPAVREALKKVLQETGYSVSVATEGEAGVGQLQQGRFHLVLLDLNLPKLSGFDILDLIGEAHPWLPVIILTGQLEHCEPGALSGADALMEKPPEVNLLLKTIAALLSEPAEERLRRLEASRAREHSLPATSRGHLHLPARPLGFGPNSFPVR